MDNKFKKIKKFWLRENYDILEGVSFMTEKLDGANFSFRLLPDGTIEYRSRNQVVIPGKKHNFHRAIQFVHDAIEGDCTKLNPNYIYYGEAMMPHTINYGEADDTPAFIGFAVKNVTYDIYIQNWSTLIGALGLPVVKQIAIVDGDYDKLISEHLHSKSNYGSTGVIQEGLVFFNPLKQMFAKVVREQFKEENMNVFGGSTVKVKTDEDKVAEMYATEARIRKQVNILKHVYGKAVEMKLMTHLPQMVMDDLLSENAGSISMRARGIEFPVLRSKIAPLCVPVLQTMVSEASVE